MATELSDLTEAKIATTKAGPECDRLVAGAIGDVSAILYRPHYSTDANAAIKALNRLQVDYEIHHLAAQGEACAVFMDTMGWIGNRIWADTFPLAAARAILVWWLANQKKQEVS